MARPGITEAQKKREGAAVRAAYDRAKRNGDVDSQEELGAEHGVSQGLIGQWMRGSTAIPDLSLLWLGRRLNFDAVSLRPSLAEYRQYFTEGESVRIDDLPEEAQRTIKTVTNAYRGKDLEHGSNGG